MDEYIKREAAITAFDDPVWKAWSKGVPIEKILNGVPADDVAPVRYGQWTKVDASYWKWKPDGAHAVHRIKYRHDECGKVSLKKENYCPGCGAKMQ